jgi:hypothetical protein
LKDATLETPDSLPVIFRVNDGGIVPDRLINLEPPYLDNLQDYVTKCLAEFCGRRVVLLDDGITISSESQMRPNRPRGLMYVQILFLDYPEFQRYLKKLGDISEIRIRDFLDATYPLAFYVEPE